MGYFLLSVLAIWRITHLIGKEDGPFDVIFLVRRKAGPGLLGTLLDCFYCLSIWVSLPFGIWLGNTWWEMLLNWWALSGAGCLLEQLTTSKRNSDTARPHFHED